MKHKKSVWMRIPIFIVSGAILYVWMFFTLIFSLVQLVLMLAEGRKEKEFVNFSSLFISQISCYFKYISFISEEKPFPWGKLKKGKKK
jgi:hypothetical protein